MKTTTIVRSLILTGAFGAALGCTAILDLGRFQEGSSSADAGDASVVGADASDASDSAPPVDPRFACLSLQNQTPQTGQVSLQLIVADVTDQQVTPAQIDGGSDLTDVDYTPDPGVTMSVCSALAPSCNNPTAGPAVTDDAGIVNFTFPGAAAIFFSGSGPGLVPFTLFPGPWPSGVPSAQYVTGALKVQDEQGLNLALGNEVQLDAGSGLGELFVVVLDCLDHHLAGATVSINPTGSSTLPFYENSGVPDLTAAQTDSSGVGGAVNVPAGSVQLMATYTATSTVMGTANVYVTAGALTYAWIRPRVH